MLLFETLFEQLATSQRIDDGNDEVYIHALDEYLVSLQHQVITSKQRKQIKNDIVDFLTYVSNQTSNAKMKQMYKLIETKFAKRFSFCYLPRVKMTHKSDNDVISKSEYPSDDASDTGSKVREDDIDKNWDLLNISSESFDETTDSVISLVSNVNLSSFSISNIPSQQYYSCKINRHKNALSTSYRMTLFRVFDMDLNRQIIQGHTSLLVNRFMIGTRLYQKKSGFYLWDTKDSALWKDKNIIGKIARNNNIYEYFHQSTESNCGITLSVQTTNDKLIQMKVVSGRTQAISNQQLLTNLNSMMKITAQPNFVTDTSIQYLKSKLPAKVINPNGSTTHTVDFNCLLGSNKSVIPSRKNLILEELGFDDYNNYNNISSVPIFQLGKIEDDVFECDFCLLSPLQAFIIAMVIMDE